MGALEREKDYANINTNPLEHSYTNYVDEDSSSWIHQIKKRMEKNNITITIKDMKQTKKKQNNATLPQESKQKRNLETD